MRPYRFPEGVEFHGEDASSASFTVSIPLDDEGFFGRECSSCYQHFRIHGDDYEALDDDLQMWCTYCGHTDDLSEFTTGQQSERVMRAAGDYAEQMIGNMLDKAFGSASGRTQSISYRSRPFYPAPLPGIDEARLVRERSCGDCSTRYAVFGEHRFCPVCGLIPPVEAALDAIAAERSRLELLTALPPAQLEIATESGILDRTRVDTIENLVGIVESTAERIFTESVPDPKLALSGKGKIFQRLNDMADLYCEHLDADIRSHLDGDWNRLEECWAARHVFTHCDGIVDAKYLAAVPGSPLRVGQRLQVPADLVDFALAHTSKLVQALRGAAT